ncbi:hypothetical protein CQA66_04090 [Helicobacter aurati]|uniref:Lipopolysaccharide heptosyltransferase family protein n=1 Tax=Helicobacter aurati TaxID=137778 RepID=A0A3D8J4Q8_9HELI|nr:glycosyltransferase family 9 protein [Helicobacter aurati]RDU72502.1 hypothetical protein CQA66_04090 [Helicobacter aurati]
MVIGFYFPALALGEMTIGFEAFYALKQIYRCKLIVFGQKGMQNLLQHCSFVDLWLPTKLEAINEQQCDYLILSNSKSWFINFAKQTNVKYIICASKIPSLFSLRCKTVPIYFCKKYRNLNEREILLSYVRRIDSKTYDSQIDTLDFNNAKIASANTHRQFVISQMQPKIKTFMEKMGEGSNGHVYFILINPFNRACPYSLQLNSWLTLAKKISEATSPLIPIIATYPQVHNEFMSSVRESQIDISNIIIFENNDDLLNLVSLISQVSLVISPSTGVIHVACNQRIPTIAVYPEYDTRRWATHNKRYVFLETPLSLISAQQEHQAIEQIVATLEEMLKTNEIKPLNLKGYVNNCD